MSGPNTVLDGFIREALELRFGGDALRRGAAPAEIVESLRQTRQRLDRVEQLLSKAIRIKANGRQHCAAVTATAELAWDRAAMARRNAPVTRGGEEFSSARERHAEANLATLTEQAAVRVAEERVRQCEEAESMIRLAHRGLEGVRQDHLAMLRMVQFESTLDR